MCLPNPDSQIHVLLYTEKGHARLTNCATGVGLSRNGIDYYDRTPSATSGWPSKCIPHQRPFIFGIPGDGNLKTGTSLSPQFTPLSMVTSRLENWAEGKQMPSNPLSHIPTSLSQPFPNPEPPLWSHCPHAATSYPSLGLWHMAAHNALKPISYICFLLGLVPRKS